MRFIVKKFCFFSIIFLSSIASGYNLRSSNPLRSQLNVATWNVRQATKDKLQNEILVNDQPVEIYKFIGRWVQDRNVNLLAMQEVYEKHRTDLNLVEDPVELILSQLPHTFKVLKGAEIRSSILKGKSNVWKAYCPIFYDSAKIKCESSRDQMLPIGLDYLNTKNSSDQSEIQSRLMPWAYCQSLDKKFDFVMTCLHANYKVAEEHVQGTANAINQVFRQKVLWPQSMRQKNLDFILAGDFNLDRRTSSVFEDLDFDNQTLDFELPNFIEDTRWKRKSFTKLKDIYTFSEARKRSKDIYDDILSSQSMRESLVAKKVDSLIDDYFIKQPSNKVDMKSLLSLSDHLPVISTFDMSLDSD